MPIKVISTVRYASGYLASGRVPVKGFDVEVVAPQPNPAAVFNDLLDHLAHDVVDLPLSNYIIARDLGKPLTAIPVFPTMFFPLLGPMVNRKAGIRTVDDLLGKRVGVSGFGFNPAVLARTILVHHYDLPIERIIWVEGEPNSMSSVPFPRSRRFTIEKAENLMQQLDQGKIDAVFMSDGGVEPTDLIDRLFADYRVELRRYVAATGTFPMNSVIVIKDDVLKANPGLDRSLIGAYREAWALYASEASDSAEHMGLGVGELRSMGLFPPPQGFQANRQAVRIMIHACYEQGLIRTLLEPEDLFPIRE